MNTDTIFKECLKLPVFARFEYLENEQIKSNFSKDVFLKILHHKWTEYKSIVFHNDLQKPFKKLVKEKGWEYAVMVHGDEPEPYEHIYSEIEIEAENLIDENALNNIEWVNDNNLWVLRNCIHELYNKWQLPSLQQTQAKVEKDTPKAFEELFYNDILITPCIDILKKVEPPLIDTEFNYIGKLKGAFCIWIEEMERQGIVKHYSDRKIYASLLPQRIKRFTIDESMFGKIHKKAENQYRTNMKVLLSQIKLSQNSQKGELGK